MTVLHFRLRAERLCWSCRVPFLPLRPSHRLCRRCYGYSRFARDVSAFRAALAEAAR